MEFFIWYTSTCAIHISGGGPGWRGMYDMKKVFALLLVCLLLAGTGAAYERKSPRNGNKPTDRLEVHPEERAGEGTLA